MKKLLIGCLLGFVSCTSLPRGQFAAIAGENQSVIFNRGCQGIFSKAETEAICSPSESIQFTSLRHQFEILINNNSDRPVTLSLDNVRAFDRSGQQLAIINAEQLEANARSELNRQIFNNVIGAIGDALSDDYQPSTRLERSNNQMLREIQSQSNRNIYVNAKAAIQNNYLQKQTIFPNCSHGGCFLVKVSEDVINRYRDNLIKIEVDIPETGETHQFAFNLSWIIE